MTPGVRGTLDSRPDGAAWLVLAAKLGTTHCSSGSWLNASYSEGSALAERSRFLRQFLEAAGWSIVRHGDLPGDPWLGTACTRAGELSAHSLKGADIIAAISDMG